MLCFERQYDTLVIGAGYLSLGYALTRGNTLVLEESEMCDPCFYLPLRGFKRSEYKPKHPLSRALSAHFEANGIYRDGMQNVSALESVYAAFLLQKEAQLFLKCRVVSQRQTEAGAEVTVVTNGGLFTLRAARVLDTVCAQGERRLALLYTATQEESEAVLRAFPEAETEPAFYRDRYVLSLPCGEDMALCRRRIADNWERCRLGAKILYVAPVPYVRPPFLQADAPRTDFFYRDPVEAFEAGCLLAEGGKR